MDFDEKKQRELDGRLADLRDAMKTGQVTPGEAAAMAIAIYKEAKWQINDVTAAFGPLMDAAKNTLAEILEETGYVSITTDVGRAYIPADGISVKYDPVALDALCASSDEFKRLLWPHRTESVRRGALTIR